MERGFDEEGRIRLKSVKNALDFQEVYTDCAELGSTAVCMVFSDGFSRPRPTSLFGIERTKAVKASRPPRKC
jgi:hypothetical protein